MYALVEFSFSRVWQTYQMGTAMVGLPDELCRSQDNNTLSKRSKPRKELPKLYKLLLFSFFQAQTIVTTKIKVS